MANKMSFDINVTPVEKSTLNLGSFKGVDYDSNLLDVDKSRASQMKNLIFRNGCNRKRNGWRQILRIEDGNFNGKQINGFWQFVDSDGEEHNIIHAENEIYTATFSDLDYKSTCSVVIKSSSYYENVVIKNKKSYGIVKGNRLYILCGTFLVYGTWSKNSNGLPIWELRKVIDNEDTYIPMTTIGICDANETDHRTTFEPVNMATKWRKNTLFSFYSLEGTTTLATTTCPTCNGSGNVGGISETKVCHHCSGTGYYTDGNIGLVGGDGQTNFITCRYCKGQGTITSTTQQSTCTTCNGSGSLSANQTINITKPNVFYLDTTSIDEDDAILLTIKTKTQGLVNNKLCEIKAKAVKKTDTNDDSMNIRIISWSKYENSTINQSVESELGLLANKVIGSIDRSNGILTLNRGYQVQEDGTPNIEVVFPKRNIIYEEQINGCSFGIIFGYNEIENLFISGNEKYPNYDWHSTSVYDNANLPTNENLTYFSALSYAKVGGSSTAISGYSRLEDNTLGIHKTKSYNESNFYLRTSRIIDNSDSTWVDVQYAHFSSVIGECALNCFTQKSLAGDNLILSDNGVFGISMSTNIKTNERYAKERSRLVNKELLKEKHLENAVAFVFENRYYLAINDKVYIADSRFKVQQSQEIDDTFSYEWWIWDNMPVNIWTTINGNLAFGTKNGNICVFDNINNFIDKSYDNINSGALTITNNDFVYSQNYNLDSNSTVDLFDSVDECLYEKVASVTMVGNQTSSIVLSSSDFTNRAIYVGDEVVYLDNIVGENPNIYTQIPYRLYVLDFEKYSICLEDMAGDIVIPNCSSFRICRKLTGEFKIKLKASANGINKFSLIGRNDINEAEIVQYNGDDTFNVCGFLRYNKPVVSMWFTPAIDFGVTNYSKTITTITVVPEELGNGEINIGWLTRKDNNTFTTAFNTDAFRVEGTNVFNIFNMNFQYFSLEPSLFTRSYTRKVRIKDFNFIQFFITNGSGKDCTINSLSIEYYVKRKNKGVK